MKKDFTNLRLKHLWVLAALAGALIAFRLVDIQFINYDSYKEKAEKNRTQAIYQTAPRGNIFTSDGTVIAGSQPSFALYYMPAAAGQKVDEEEIASLAKTLAPLLREDEETLLVKIKRAAASGKAAVISENISTQNILPIAEIQNYYREIYLMEEAKRFYPLGIFASHLIGYISRMDGYAWRTRDVNLGYRLNSMVGRFGVEKQYESTLRGSDGGLFLEVDYRGRVRKIIEDKKSVPGSDIYTTLNLKVQQAAEEGLKNSLTERGAAVALDPRTGAVLALASAPGFDPNIFVPFNDQNTGEEKKKVREYNLAVQGAYPPASTFKIMTAFAALMENKLNTEAITLCTGEYDSGPRVFKCWAKHGPQNFWQAMANSCDVYFYTLAARVGPAPVERAQRAFQFGQPTGIDIPGERGGNLFGPTRRARNKSYWFIGDTLNLSIGQGELLATPVKMAQFAAALASRGKIWRPYFIDRVVSPDGKVSQPVQSKQVGTADFTTEQWDIIFKALKGVAENGTAKVAKTSGIDVYAKTGTAQNRGTDHAWFIGFSAKPGQEPDFAFAVFIENGVHGYYAGLIARDMIKAYYGIAAPPPVVKKSAQQAAAPQTVTPEVKKTQEIQKIQEAEKEFAGDDGEFDAGDENVSEQ